MKSFERLRLGLAQKEKRKRRRRSLHTSSNLKIQSGLATETTHPGTETGDLPYDMICEVLLRSDVKVVFRCKSLCKYFYTILGSLKFAKEYYEHRSNDQRLIVRRTNPVLVMYNESDLSEHKLKHKHKHLRDVNIPDHYQVIGNLDGVLCVMKKCFGSIALLNLSTRQVKKLPVDLEKGKKSLFEFSRAVGLGLDPVSGDHKVVVMAYLPEWVVEEGCRCRVYVCTSVDDSWRRVPLSEDDVEAVVLKCPVTPSMTNTFLKGVYYWLLDDGASDFATVVGFDMGSEKLSARRVGECRRGAQRFGTLALHCGDALELLMLDHPAQSIEIWRMEECCWTRSFTIALQPLLHPLELQVHRVLFYWKRDEILLQGYSYSYINSKFNPNPDYDSDSDSSVLIFYNVSSQKLKRIGFGIHHQPYASRKISNRYHSWVFSYKNSIVRINGDTEHWDSSDGFFFPY